LAICKDRAVKASRTVTCADIVAAQTFIAGIIRRTPTIGSPELSEHCSVPVHLKLEHQQVTGSFKLRGAAYAVSRLTDVQRRRGVVGVSTGNHGRALAYASRNAGAHCVICMSELVPSNKIDSIKALGAEVQIVGRSQDEAQLEVDRMVRDKGMIMVPPFDNAEIIAGQGTLGLEICAQIPEVGTILVPVSGGGLISGVALALKAYRRNIRVIGVSMERGAAMKASILAGSPVEVDEKPSFADSLGGGIGLNNQFTFAMVRELVDEIILVNEAEIAAGVRHAYYKERQIVEGAGAVCIAALLSGKVQPNGPTLALLSGGNIDMELHHRLISGEIVDAGQPSESSCQT
jgi:threonine dehydratase